MFVLRMQISAGSLLLGKLNEQTTFRGIEYLYSLEKI